MYVIYKLEDTLKMKIVHFDLRPIWNIKSNAWTDLDMLPRRAKKRQDIYLYPVRELLIFAQGLIMYVSPV